MADQIPPPPPSISSPKLSPRSKLHSPTINSLNSQKKKDADGENSDRSSSVKSMSGEELPVVKNNLDAVESRLHLSTASTTNATYKPKAEEDSAPPPPPVVQPISPGSNLLKPTAAAVSASWTGSPKATDRKSTGETLTPISPDSHLLQPTRAGVSATWTASEEAPAPAVTTPISADSHLLSATAAVKAAAWTPKEEAAEAGPVVPISADSGLLKSTAAVKAASWSPKEEVAPPTQTKTLDPASPLLRTTKARIASSKTLEEAPASPVARSSSRSVSPVPASLLQPTAATKNLQRSKVPHSSDDNSEAAESAKWVSNTKIHKSPLDEELSPVSNNLDNVSSRLDQPTASTLQAVYKPKEKSDEVDIHGAPFSLGPSKNVSIPEAPPALPAIDSPYSSVKSRLLEPTAASQMSAKKEDSAGDEGAAPIRAIAPDSNLLKPTAAVSSGNWSPKQEAKKQAPLTALSPDSRLLKGTKAADEAKWKVREEESSPVHDVTKVTTPVALSPSLTRATVASEQSTWDKEQERTVTENQRGIMLANLGTKKSTKEGDELSGEN